MRILMLSQFYPPLIGGEEQHVRILSIELVSRGHDVAVVTTQQPGQAEFELDRGVQVYRVRSSMRRLPWLFSDSGRQYAPPFPDPEVTLALRRIIANKSPQIVHAHNWMVHSFLPLKAWSGARLIVTLHNYNLACAKETLLYHNARCAGPGMAKCLACAGEHYGPLKGTPTVLSNWMMGQLERGAADMFLAVSQAVAVGNGLTGKRLPFQVIPNFMPCDAAVLQGNSEPYLAQLPAGDFLLFAGAFGYAKGVDVLLRAYTGLTDAPPLVLIGYPTPDWPLLAAHCPDNVVVLTNWPRHAVIEAWRRSMIALAPSVWPEPFCIAVLEAMWTGRPVIASRTGGLVDLVADGETGLLVEPGDPSDLQQAIKRLLAHPHLRARMGQAALRKVKDFQAGTVVPRIEQVYEQVLS
jgi:glycosyltransferase involved in cell wall biosynthesis